MALGPAPLLCLTLAPAEISLGGTNPSMFNEAAVEGGRIRERAVWRSADHPRLAHFFRALSVSWLSLS